MKPKSIVIFSFIVLGLLMARCSEKDIIEKEYIELKSVGFFKLSNQEIVDSISNILNVETFAFAGIVDRWEEEHGMAGSSWIKEGKKYENAEGQSLILWTDSLLNLSAISYLNYRRSTSDIWSNSEIQLENFMNNIFSEFGFVQKPNEEYQICESAIGIQNIKWYDILCNQTFHADTIKTPGFKAELEGDTCKINYLMIPVWYTNLDDINSYMNDSEMEDIAINFFVDTYEGNNEAIESSGYSIVYNKLCKTFNSRIVGIRGNHVVYIDIQTGEVVYNTEI